MNLPIICEGLQLQRTVCLFDKLSQEREETINEWVKTIRNSQTVKERREQEI